ncbi:MAG: wax ester/triacylglycerol synthase family O-acyltransferase [Proteobacteria bacterium]|nr:wax ester/triacylglycerol synthase family O-acyltransferase [Pseudomonadota bacterium]
MRKLSVLDLAFFLTESEDSPKHVAGLLLCKKPTKCPANFAGKLVEELKSHDKPTEPFNLVINLIGWKGPHWTPCSDFDIDEHVFYHRPEKVIAWEDVKEFVTRLHEPLMDRSKPLWEFHLIDGIKGSKFAIYIKLHHAYADGMTMTSWLNRTFSNSPEDRQLRPIWTLPPRNRPKEKEVNSSVGNMLGSLTKQAWDQLLTTGGIAKLTAQQYLEFIGITHNAATLPFSAHTNTPMTGSASPGRCLGTSWVSMAKVKRICKATRSTLNHVALTCIDGGLHRYLEEQGITLDQPITIQMPVNLRKDGDDKDGNSVGIVLVKLAEPTDDPFVRLREIGFTLRNVRNQIDGVRGSSVEQYTILSAMFSELIEKTGLSDTLWANGHTLVSNVPGSKEKLYLKGAMLEQMYPISTLIPGLRMNITLFSYGGKLHFGIVATQDMEDLDVLAQYMEEEFQNLENAVFDKG